MTSLEEAAVRFVTTTLRPAIDGAEDGGSTLMRVAAEHFFQNAAQMDADRDTENVIEFARPDSHI
jgi:hypothetical protein